MKVAAVTNDGKIISGHFGRASHYVVVTVEDGRVTLREMRPKTSRQNPVPRVGAELGCRDGQGKGHGFGTVARGRHAPMIAVIADCDVVLSRGMGRGMYQNLQQAGIFPILTTVPNIDEAVAAYLQGRLENHPELIH